MTRTVSICESSAAAFFLLSRALAFAVVDRTAVATFSNASFVGGFVGAGYANRLGLAFETISNLGTLRSSFKPMMPVGSNARLAQCASGN